MRGHGAEVLETSSIDHNATIDLGAQIAKLEAFKVDLDLCLREFLSGGDVVEAARCIKELGAPGLHLHVVKRSVASISPF